MASWLGSGTECEAGTTDAPGSAAVDEPERAGELGAAVAARISAGPGEAVRQPLHSAVATNPPAKAARNDFADAMPPTLRDKDPSCPVNEAGTSSSGMAAGGLAGEPRPVPVLTVNDKIGSAQAIFAAIARRAAGSCQIAQAEFPELTMLAQLTTVLEGGLLAKRLHAAAARRTTENFSRAS